MARNPQMVGIETYHEKHCSTHAKRRCNCTPSYRGTVYDARTKRVVKGPRTKVVAEARGWRFDAIQKLKHGALQATAGTTVAEAAERWLEQAKAGAVRDDGGRVYKPATLRNYECSLHQHVLPTLGSVKLGRLTRAQVQHWVDRLALERQGSTVCNAVTPLRVLCRHALARQQIASNPCIDLELPARGPGRFSAINDRGGRESIATPAEAGLLIGVIPRTMDRAIWATAFYAGLRRGELRGLHYSDIDLDDRVIRVRRGWDALDGEIDTKTSAALRDVPVISPLAASLDEYLQAHDGGIFAFPGYGRWGRDYGPFSADALLRRSRRAWDDEDLEPIGLHEARHTYASLMIAAGVPLAQVSRLMGHSSISVTERHYFHLLPNSHDTAREAIETMLRAHTSD